MKQNLGEKIAENFLRNLGYRVIERNFRVHMVGEVDLICLDGDEIVFVEVRERSRRDFGDPEGSIGFKKLAKIVRTAEIYMLSRRVDLNFRIDVVAICGGRVEHLKNVV